MSEPTACSALLSQSDQALTGEVRPFLYTEVYLHKMQSIRTTYTQIQNKRKRKKEEENTAFAVRFVFSYQTLGI